MATLINTTNEALSELQTAPGGGTFNNMLFSRLAQPGWNEGTFGSNSFTNYTWGLGYGNAGGGLDAIYGLSPLAGTNPPFGLSAFRGLQYWFDGSTFDITYRWANSIAPPPPPPPIPPSAYDVLIEFVITDSSLNYSIFGGPNTPPNYQISFNANAGGALATTQIPGFTPDSYVLPKDVYWIMTVTTDATWWAGGTIDLLINGSTVLTSALAAGTNNFDYTSSGLAGLTNANGIALEFYVT